MLNLLQPQEVRSFFDYIFEEDQVRPPLGRRIPSRGGTIHS
jgi:hypothetical protein